MSQPLFVSQPLSSMSSTQLIAVSLVIGVTIAYMFYRSQHNLTNSLLNKTIYGCNSLIKLSSTNQISFKLPPRILLVTDLDHTLFGLNPNQTHDQCNTYIKNFNKIWCEQYAPNNCVLIYATGRNFQKYQLAVTEWDILKPDILVTQDGVSIHWFNKSLAQQVQSKSTHKIDMSFDDTMESMDFLWNDTSWQATLEEGWNQSLAENIYNEVKNKYELLAMPPGSKEIESFRIGILIDGHEMAKEIEQLFIKRVNEYNYKNKNKNGFVAMNIHTFTCVERYTHNAYWSAFTPLKAGKGAAIEFLRKRLMVLNRNVICCGDSGNDISMLKIDGYNSVIVSNSSTELLNFYDDNKNKLNIIKTNEPKTLGVIEGLQYYGVGLLKH
eukprot:230705_1